MVAQNLSELINIVIFEFGVDVEVIDDMVELRDIVGVYLDSIDGCVDRLLVFER
jgi:hypothetical protein